MMRVKAVEVGIPKPGGAPFLRDANSHENIEVLPLKFDGDLTPDDIDPLVEELAQVLHSQFERTIIFIRIVWEDDTSLGIEDLNVVTGAFIDKAINKLKNYLVNQLAEERSNSGQ